jgi:hypothetical protein
MTGAHTSALGFQLDSRGCNTGSMNMTSSSCLAEILLRVLTEVSKARLTQPRYRTIPSDMAFLLT